jgi:hypothetical protein
VLRFWTHAWNEIFPFRGAIKSTFVPPGEVFGYTRCKDDSSQTAELMPTLESFKISGSPAELACRVAPINNMTARDAWQPFRPPTGPTARLSNFRLTIVDNKRIYLLTETIKTYQDSAR